MSELGRVQEALWSIYEDLRAGDVDEDEAEALTGVLDSLIHVHEIESRHQRIQQQAKQRSQ